MLHDACLSESAVTGLDRVEDRKVLVQARPRPRRINRAA